MRWKISLIKQNNVCDFSLFCKSHTNTKKNIFIFWINLLLLFFFMIDDHVVCSTMNIAFNKLCCETYIKLYAFNMFAKKNATFWILFCCAFSRAWFFSNSNCNKYLWFSKLNHDWILFFSLQYYDSSFHSNFSILKSL